VAGSPTETCLTVRDDGLGFDPEHTARGGMGLQIMRYRAESLGGALTLRSRPGDGAEVRCIVPSTPQEPAA
jgi:signal transduction histidine kinase